MPFGVSSVAQAAAVASLAAEDELLQRVGALVEERTRVQAALREQGWSSVPDSQANFVWLRLGERTTEFAGRLRGGRCRRPPVRAARVPGSPIGEPEANDLFLQVAKDFAG